jgi:hypothetical protein
MDSRPASRRRFLGLLLGFSAWALVNPVGRLFGFDRAEAGDRRAYGLADFFKHRKSAEVVGLEYLKQTPHERDVNVLVDRIFESSAGRRDRFAQAGVRRRRAMLQEQTQDDFERGRVVKIEGWILSLTEARLCALAAVLRTSG